MLRQWQIEFLDKKNHLREGFSCGEESLDSYLKIRARKAQESGTGRTWVALDGSEPPDEAGRRPVLGYYTVAMSSIDVSVMPAPASKRLPRQVPAALLARLAVDESAQEERLGSFLLIDALTRVAKASEEASAYAVVLDALTDKAKGSYGQYGFLELTDNPMHLFLPMASVLELVSSPSS
ncbi:MAG: GNAT family N-acetyltransferase [Deltaproteobacteria bacterium]|nr:GNAT family N-acetyltransferase [Deltaproteobacteria bacterium]